MVFLDKVYEFIWCLVHFYGSLFSSFAGHIICLFISQSRPIVIFPSGLALVLGCAGQCKVILLCFWILCGILSSQLGTIRGLLTSSKSFTLFGLLIFFKSSVGTLWVCSCFVPLFWIKVVFSYGPFIQVRVLHVGTCFISSASLSWMVVNFLNQKPCIQSWPGVFQFDIFSSVVLR